MRRISLFTLRRFLQSGFFSGIDAAIARLKTPDSIVNRIPVWGKLGKPIKLNEYNEGKSKIAMYGNISGFQNGKVNRVEVSKVLRMENQVFGFSNLIETDLSAEKGDSGAPVFLYSDEKEVVGIVMGKEENRVYVVSIHQILNFFLANLLPN